MGNLCKAKARFPSDKTIFFTDVLIVSQLNDENFLGIFIPFFVFKIKVGVLLSR